MTAPFRLVKRCCRQLGGIALILCANPAAALEAPAPLPADTLLLFVASWCAPCRAELAQVEAIARAAAPRRTRVVPLDDGAATAAMLRKVPPALIWSPDARESALLRRRLLARTAGLPFSAMTDAAGEPCALHRAVLTPAAVAAMRGACPPPPALP